MKIMIIEDEITIREELSILLRNALYETIIVTEFKNVSEQVIEHKPDLILLDINLPGQNGLKICTDIRKSLDTPIIFVTSNNSSMDELQGMMMGGDDYIAKPYNPPILLARIAVILKRTQKNKQADDLILSYKGVMINLETYTMEYQGNSSELTKNELKILAYMFKHPDKVIPRLDLIEHLWDHQIFIDDNNLSVYITRIRSKLEQIGVFDFIETKRGAGYRI